MDKLTILEGDALEQLRTLVSDSVHCVVTSPPYYGLRDYGTGQWEGGNTACDHTRHAQEALNQRVCSKCGAVRHDHQLGLEPTLEEYLGKLVEVFTETRRVLRPDGVCFVNIGDSYANCRSGKDKPSPIDSVDYKPKDRLLVPFRLALALQADGWWVRDVICWAKRRPMPENVTDRCTQAWEPILMLTKSGRYYWDAESVKEQLAENSAARYGYAFGGTKNTTLVEANVDGMGVRTRVIGKREAPTGRNLRNFWCLGPAHYPEAHFATFPTEVPKRCILAGSPMGGTVLDPFLGSGTTAAVALELGRNAIGIELNPRYCELARARCGKVTPGLALGRC